ncbi:polycystin-1-like [Lytechinus pictus]|uniref:polycystin-1-like n=1 Tax=Lytechinus pictus TaxID=7653 RepID=UPI0030B9EDE9
MPGVSGVYTAIPVKLLVLLLTLCPCRCHQALSGEDELFGMEMGQPCRDIPYDDVNDAGDVFKWPLSTEDDLSLPNLAQFRHGGVIACIDDLDHCHNGFTASFNITLDKVKALDSGDVIAFTPALSLSAYESYWEMPVSLRLEEIDPVPQIGVFKVRVKTSDLAWDIDFTSRLDADHPILVGLTWKRSIGLDVYVDDVCAGSVVKGSFRKLSDKTQTEYGDGIITIPPDKFQFVEFLRPTGSLLDFRNEDTAYSYYLGCLPVTKLASLDLFRASLPLSAEDSAVISCRRSCYNKVTSLYALIGENKCQCADDITTLDQTQMCGEVCPGYSSLPCGSEAELSVYLTSSLVTQLPYPIAEDISPSDPLSDIRPLEMPLLHSHARYRRSSENEETDSLLVRHRRSTDFIALDDINGLVNTILNFTYIIYTETSELTCSWTFGDDTETLKQAEAEHGTQYQHQYTQPGDFTATVDCSGIQDSASVTVWSSIDGLTSEQFSIQQVGTTATLSDVTIQVTRTGGEALPGRAIFILNGLEEVFVPSPSTQFETTWSPTKFGTFPMDAIISNKVEEDIVLSLNVTVGDAVSETLVTVSGPLGTNQPLNVTVQISGGSNVTVDVDFDEGDPVSQHPLIVDYTWIISYATAGTKNIRVTAYNVFGSESQTEVVEIIQSVVGLQLSVTPLSVGTSEFVDCRLTAGPTVINDVTCTILTGDGQSFIRNDVTLNSQLEYSESFSYSQEFLEPVKVSATCSNAVSNQTVEKYIVVGKTVQSCSIYAPDAQVVREDDETVILVEGGNSLTIELNFDDDSGTVSVNSEIPGRISVNHSFSMVGIYNVTATVRNSQTSNISCASDNATIYVQDRIPASHLFALSSSPDAIDVTVEQQINFTLTLDSGQSIPQDTYITFLFSQQCTCSLSMKLENHLTFTGAIYNVSGTYNVTAVISNRVSAATKQMQVWAVEGLGEVTVTPSAEALLVGDVLEFTVLPASGTEILINITWGDGSHDDRHLSSAASVTFNHTYNTLNEYEVCVSVYNALSPSARPNCTTIQILYPVQGLTFNTNTQLVIDNSCEFVIGLLPEIPHPSGMTCKIDRGDGTNPLVINEDDISSFPHQIQCLYVPALKNYLATLHCFNVLGSLNLTKAVSVRKPISDVFELKVLNLFRWLSESTVWYELSVKEYEDIPFGYADFYWDFGDGNYSHENRIMLDRTISKTKKFTVEGLYQTNVTISYGLWNGVLTAQVTVAQKRDLDVSIRYFGGDRNGEYGGGQNETWFYKNNQLKFTPVPLYNDTQYVWKYSSDQPSSSEDEFIHEFESTGVFVVTVEAKHPLYTDNLVTFLHIVSPFTFEDIVVEDGSGNETQKLKTYSKLNITLLGQGLTSPLCILWVFCNETLYFSGPPNCYNAAYSSGEPGVAWSTDGQVLTHVEFNTPGEFNLTVIITNNMDSDASTASLSKVITIVGCLVPPVVTISGSGSSREQPKVYLRSDKFRLTSTVRLWCFGLEQPPLFQWSTMMIDPYDENANFTDLDDKDGSYADIEPLTFEVGLYNLTMTVTVTDTTPDLSGTDFAYMRIDPSPLIVTIAGGSARSVNGLKDIHFNASGSRNPDQNLEDQDLSQWNFTWSCKSNHDTTPTPTVPNGICEQTTEQTIPGKVQPLFTIEAKRLALDTKYIIRVDAIHADGRFGSYEQAIQTVPGTPVLARIDCITNCLLKVNPTSPVSYQAHCENCATQNATYLWEMTTGEEERELVDLEAKAASELTKSGLQIKSNVLESGKFYYVRVYVEEPGMLQGFVEVSFYTNLVPFGGTCDMFPRNGSALVSDFTASCDEWKDEGDAPEYDERSNDESVLLYRVQFRAMGLDADYAMLVQAAEAKETRGLKFPIGPKSANYTFQVLFTILDKFGGIAQVQRSIQVFLEEAAVEKDELLTLFSEKGDLNALTQSKDPEAGMRLLGAVISVVSQATDLTTEDTVLVKDKSINVLTELAAMSKTSDGIGMAAEGFSSLYASYPPPSENQAINAATSLEEMTSNYADISGNTAEDIKRTGDSLIGTCGNMMTVVLTSMSSNSSGSNVTEEVLSPDDQEGQIEENNFKMKMVSTLIVDVIDKVSDLITSKLVAGQAPAISTGPSVEVRCQVNAPEDLTTNDDSIQAEAAQIGFPPAFSFIGEDIGQKLIATKIISYAVNPFSYAGGSNILGSSVVSIELQTADRKKIPVSNASEPLRLVLQTEADAPETLEVDGNITQKRPMSYHQFNISKPDDDFRAVIRGDGSSGFWVFAKFENPPLNDSYDVVQRLPRELNDTDVGIEGFLKEEIRNTFVLSKEEHCGNGTYFIGIMPAGSDEEFASLISNSTKCSGEERLLVINANNENTTAVSIAYNISFYSSACRYYDNITDEWNSDGCWTGIMTSTRETHCLCNHLTSFASAFFVPPNKIDFSDVFSKSLLDNFAVMGTIIVIVSIYLLLLIYARRKDKQDLIKWGVTPLSDNHPAHTYGYQVTVETGVRPGAGTKSKVGIMISGEDADTGSRVLDDPKRPVFQSGCINSFLMTVPRPLGLLTYVRIWHDNSGAGGQAGWFLSKVSVMDLQTGKEFFFLCEQWLAVEQGDGSIDRTLFVASKKDMTQVGQLVYTSGRKNLSDQHLWFSLFSRPTRSSFNRCQRLCCCLTLLCTSMLANALFYKVDVTAAQAQAIKIGPITITPSQIGIGISSSLVVMPVNLIIAQIFRKARPLESDAPDPLVALIRRIFTRKKRDEEKKPLDQFNFEEKRHDKAISEKEVNVNVVSGQSATNPSSDPPPAEQSAAAAATKKKYPLPHWTVYLAYILSFIACFLSCFFVVLYSLEWGKEKAHEWLKSMIVSFFSSAFIIQPTKVIVIVFIVSIIFKKPSKMNDADAEGLKDKTMNKLQTDEEYLHEDSLTAGKAPGYSARPKTPPSKQILEKARKERLRDVQVSGVVRDFVLYALYLVVILFLAYTNRDPDSFRMSETIRNTFVSDNIDYLVDGVNPVTFGALTQSTPDEFWNYIEQTLLPGLYGFKYYNGEVMKWRDARFLRDWQNYRVGPARLRQLRVKPLPCEVNGRMEHVVKDCTLDYSWSNEDEGIFAANWTYTCDPSDENIPNYAYYEVDETRPWRYRSAVDLYGVPYQSNLYFYGGGGFIAEFGVNREQAMDTARYLRNHGWYDKYTRAIFIEFTVYNANVNLFSVVTLLLETPSLGGGVISNTVHTFRLYQYVGGLGFISIAFQGIFVVYLLYFLGHFVYRLKKEGRKELKNVWTILEGNMLLFAFFSAVMFIMREVFIRFTLQEVKKKDEGGYVNFNHIAKWDQIFGYLLATLTFISILRFMRTLRFSARVTHVAMAFQRASRDMLYFLLMWCLIVIAFALWGYAIFSRSIFTFHTFQGVLESLLGMMIGSFDFYALQSVESVIGPIFFTLYIFAAYFMLANMLITIIVEAFAKSKEDPDKDDSTFPIGQHMMKKFKMMLASYGIGSNSVGPAPKKPNDKNSDDKDKEDVDDEGNDPAYKDMMDTIENRVDQLVTYVLKNYGDGKGAPMGSKATLNTFEAMVKKDIETVKQKKTRTIMIS